MFLRFAAVPAQNQPSSTDPRNISIRLSTDSPRTGAASAPVNNSLASTHIAPTRQSSHERTVGDLSPLLHHTSSPRSFLRRRAHSNDTSLTMAHSFGSPPTQRTINSPSSRLSPSSSASRKSLSDASMAMAKARARTAQKKNDAMVYLDGPQIYTCAQCRTHLTSHDDIISKSFHGRHGKCEKEI